MIKSINVLSFGPINNAECDGLGQINLFIGHNGSGKTFLLKALYSALKTVEAYKRGKEQRTEKEILSDKLYWMFQSPALGELVRKGDNALQFTMKSDKDEIFSYSFGPSTIKNVATVTNTFAPKSDNTIFLPAKEILSLRDVILEARENFTAFGFDDAYYGFGQGIAPYHKRAQREWLWPVENVKSTVILEPDKFHFTFTGNVSRYQNLVNTIEGFVKAGLVDAQLNIVGDGSYMANVQAAIAGLDTKNVVFHGRRPYNEMYDVMMQSNVLLLPLMPNEGIEKAEPLKLQSYLQAGKPILGILNGAGRDIIEDNKLGICVSPTDTDDISEGFRRMLEFALNNTDSVYKAAHYLMHTRYDKSEIVNRITKNLIIR